METEVQGYLVELVTIKGQISEALRGLNDDGANWRPLPKDTNSIYAILSHLMDADTYWIRQVIGREVIKLDRSAALQAKGSLKELISCWEEANREMESVVGKLSLAQLEETRAVSGRPELGDITVRWCILHLISHHALHLGHIQLTRQLWNQQP